MGAVEIGMNAGCGSITRDHDENLIIAFANNLGRSSVLIAECWAIPIQIAWAKRHYRFSDWVGL